MFGISPLGWLHTLGSLPAIPAALYMFARHGRIVPRSRVGALYFVTMLVGGATVFLVAKQQASVVVGVVTLALLFAGYGVAYLRWLGRASIYLETIFLSFTAFLLLLPAVSETLRRVPDGHPLVTDLKSPVLLGVQGALFAALLVVIVAQIVFLRRKARTVGETG